MLCVTLGSLYVDAQGYVPAVLENLHGMFCSETYWLLGGGWFQCRYGGFWTVSYHLMFCVVRSFLVFSSFGLKSPASGFLPVVSRLLQLYSTDNKTSRLMVKRFSLVRDTQRGSQSYMKKRRGRREIEMSRRRQRGTQERDRSIQLSVPKVLSVAQTPTQTHRIGLGREGERRKQRCSEMENGVKSGRE